MNWTSPCYWIFIGFVIVVVIIPWIAVRIHDSKPDRGSGKFQGENLRYGGVDLKAPWYEQLFQASILAEQRRS